MHVWKKVTWYVVSCGCEQACVSGLAHCMCLGVLATIASEEAWGRGYSALHVQSQTFMCIADALVGWEYVVWLLKHKHKQDRGVSCTHQAVWAALCGLCSCCTACYQVVAVHVWLATAPHVCFLVH